MLAQTSELSEAWMTEPRWPHKAVGYGAQFQCALKSHPKFKPNLFIKPKDADDSVGLYFFYYYIKWFIEKKNIKIFPHAAPDLCFYWQTRIFINKASQRQTGRQNWRGATKSNLPLLASSSRLLAVYRTMFKVDITSIK